MAYVFFDRNALADDLLRLSEGTSYRHIAKCIDNKISVSTLYRIANKKSDLSIEQVEILMPILHTQYEDYLVRHLF